MSAPTFSAEAGSCEPSTQAGAIQLSKSVPFVERNGALMPSLDFQIDRAPTYRGSDADKFGDQKRADASLSKFRKHIQLFDPAAYAVMLNSEKRATERDADRSLIFLQSDEHKAEPVIFDDPFDDTSNLG